MDDLKCLSNLKFLNMLINLILSNQDAANKYYLHNR